VGVLLLFYTVSRQLTVTYLNADKRFLSNGLAIPQVVLVSLVTSGGMVIYSVVRKVLAGTLGNALLQDGGGDDGAAPKADEKKVAPAETRPAETTGTPKEGSGKPAAATKAGGQKEDATPAETQPAKNTERRKTTAVVKAGRLVSTAAGVAVTSTLNLV